MATVAPTLFSWQDVEASSDILRLQRVLAALPDKKLLATLQARRKGRRDRYPLVALWHSLIAALLFNLQGPAALIRELKRNGELRHVCGFDPLLGEQAIPPPWVYSRFFTKLVAVQPLLEEIFHALIERLAKQLPDFGRRLAVDAKALHARHPSQPDADLGRKTEPTPEGDERIVFSWFGFKLHLLCDTTHELPIAFDLTPASANDSPHLLPLVEDTRERHPRLLGRAEELAADRAYDDGQDKRALYEDFAILPLLPARDCAQGQNAPLDPRHHDTVYVSPTGEVLCKVRPFERNPQAAYCPMQYQGFEKDRNTLKFRCPAAAFGVECHNQQACRSAAKDQEFGRVVRLPLDTDRRLHLPLYQHAQAFRDRYKRRTAVERLFFRLDHFYGFEIPLYGDLRRVRMQVTLGLAAMLATALAWIRQGQADKIRCKFQAAA